MLWLILAATIDINASFRHLLVIDPTPTAIPGLWQVTGTTIVGV